MFHVGYHEEVKIDFSNKGIGYTDVVIHGTPQEE